MGQKLIDADSLMKRMVRKKAGQGNRRYTEGYNDALFVCRSMIHSEKTVDAVPVIRCFKCKHAWIHPCGYVLCHRDGRSAYEMTFSLDSFCSYGERKEGVDNG